jgi:hypothetical protein
VINKSVIPVLVLTEGEKTLEHRPVLNVLARIIDVKSKKPEVLSNHIDTAIDELVYNQQNPVLADVEPVEDALDGSDANGDSERDDEAPGDLMDFFSAASAVEDMPIPAPEPVQDFESRADQELEQEPYPPPVESATEWSEYVGQGGDANAPQYEDEFPQHPVTCGATVVVKEVVKPLYPFSPVHIPQYASLELKTTEERLRYFKARWGAPSP